MPLDWRLETVAELPSTSDAVIARAEAGEPAGLALLAERQSAGRGRSGRDWLSPPGNLYLSVLLRPAGPAREARQWALLAGVALHEAAAGIAPDPAQLRLKWPNDLLRDGAKCAGILADSAVAGGDQLAWLVLGFGVNLAVAPALPDRPSATLGAAEPPAAFAGRLLECLGHWCVVHAAQGFAPIRAAWVARGPAPGALLPGMEGTFAGLADDGSLRIAPTGAGGR
jgi:BirA family biotin operon repressor/biotin-[acetyl-CoA-carboxylase] ligase